MARRVPLFLFPLVLLLIGLCTAASAHSLRVFARVDGASVSGYAFFIGGGRPDGAGWTAQMGDQTLASGRTDAQGAFRFPVPAAVTAEVVVTVNTGEGHVAAARLAPDRFGAAAPAGTPTPTEAPDPDPPDADQTRQLVETAVARQVAPLLERIEQMDARMRLTDIVAGICLILGIAGIALWARGRRR